MLQTSPGELDCYEASRINSSTFASYTHEPVEKLNPEP